MAGQCRSAWTGRAGARVRACRKCCARHSTWVRAPQAHTSQRSAALSPHSAHSAAAAPSVPPRCCAAGEAPASWEGVLCFVRFCRQTSFDQDLGVTFNYLAFRQAHETCLGKLVQPSLFRRHGRAYGQLITYTPAGHHVTAGHAACSEPK